MSRHPGKIGRSTSQLEVNLSLGSNCSRRLRGAGAASLERREEVLAIAASMEPPFSVRQCFYQCSSVYRVVEKTERGYRQVQRDLALLRRAGEMPWDWIADYTRTMRKPVSHDNLVAALDDCARLYRRNVWRDAGVYVEIWIEKDALTGVVYPVTAEYDVPLMSARGYSSITFLQSAARYIHEVGKPTFIYHLGDYDPSGQNAADTIERDLREFSGGADITFTRLAVTPEQIKAWQLPTRPTKASDPRARRFGRAQSVELDAIAPDLLRSLVRDAIEQHMPAHQLDVLREVEKDERRVLMLFADTMASPKGAAIMMERAAEHERDD
jgi:hypothetical protein